MKIEDFKARVRTAIERVEDEDDRPVFWWMTKLELELVREERDPHDGAGPFPEGASHG